MSKLSKMRATLREWIAHLGVDAVLLTVRDAAEQEALQAEHLWRCGSSRGRSDREHLTAWSQAIGRFVFDYKTKEKLGDALAKAERGDGKS